MKTQALARRGNLITLRNYWEHFASLSLGINDTAGYLFGINKAQMAARRIRRFDTLLNHAQTPN